MNPRLIRRAAGVLIASVAGTLVPLSVTALDLDPKVVSNGSVPGGTATEVAIAGNYAYVVVYESGLQIVDISDPTNPRSVGGHRAAGYSGDVTISGNYAYLATDRRFEFTNYVGGGVEIIDISNPSNPHLVGSYSNRAAKAVAISGSYAYVAAYTGLRVLDISDPSAPQDIGGVALDASALAISGEHLYLTLLNQGLRVFDLSDPANPDPVGAYTTNGYFLGVAVAGGYAYLADRTTGLHVVDVSQPTNPQPAGHYACSPYDLAISGSYVYVVAQPRVIGTNSFPGGLHIVQVSDPANPQLAGWYDTIDASSVAAAASYAYVLNANSLAVIDVSVVSSPEAVGGYFVERDARDVALAGAYAYVADGVAGLEVYNISNSISPERVGGFFVGAPANSVALAGNHALLVAGSALYVVNIIDPANPQSVGRYDTGDNPRNVTVAGSFAYVASKPTTNGVGGGLHVINISNPANPQRVGGYSSSSNAVDVALAGSHAYLTIEPQRNGGIINVPGALEVINISNPANPQRVSRYVTAEQTQGVAVSGNYAYVADGVAGLHVIDIGNPTAPLRRAVFPLTSYPWNPSIIGGSIGSAFSSVTVSGNHCYIAEMFLHFSHGIWPLGSSVQVVDISNATELKRVGSLRAGDYDTSRTYVRGSHVQGMIRAGNRLFMAGGRAGLQVIDIVSPASSQITGRYDGSAGERGVALAGNYACVATERHWTGGGLQIVDVSNPANPQLVGASPGDDATGVAVSGTNACAIIGITSLGVFDISDASNPKSLGRYEAGAPLVNLAVQGNYAYAVAKPNSGRGGLHVIDISNPAEPRQAGRYDSGGEAFDIALSGNYAYMAQGLRWTGSNYASGGLQVIDISNPTNPQRVGSYDTSGSAHGVAVSGNFAYLVGDGIGLDVLNVSNPGSPQRVGAIAPDPLGNGKTLAVSGGYAHIMDSEGRLQVVDVREPTQPRLVGGNSSFTAFFGDVPGSIAIANGKVFTTVGSSGLFVLHPYQAIRLQQLPQLPSGIRLQISGPPGVPGRVQRSGDLRNWTDWQSVNFGEEAVEVTDTVSGIARFYRVGVP